MANIGCAQSILKCTFHCKESCEKEIIKEQTIISHNFPPSNLQPWFYRRAAQTDQMPRRYTYTVSSSAFKKKTKSYRFDRLAIRAYRWQRGAPVGEPIVAGCLCTLVQRLKLARWHWPTIDHSYLSIMGRLKGISTLLSPDLLHTLSSMGHGDEIGNVC